MLKLLNRLYFSLFLISLLSFSLNKTHAEVINCDEVVKNVLTSWRSSDRFIPGGIIRQQAETFIASSLRRDLAQCSMVDAEASLLRLKDELKIDKGVAENLYKIQKITQLCMKGECPFEKDRISPLAREEDRILHFPVGEKLEALLSAFPDAPSLEQQVPGSYVFRRDLLAQESVSSPIKNDHYAFTIGSVFFNEGMHASHKVVMENLSRGSNDWPFMVSYGQDQVIDMLENLRFQDWEVEALKRRVTTKWKADPAFWTWLRQWRFTGDIDGLAPGTISFPNLPALYVTTDPISALIVESKINPIMSSYTKWMTNVVRIIIAKKGIKSLQEAGTRRVLTGTLSALTALFAGVEGTSNVYAAELLGKYSYGTTPHSGIMMFHPNEESGFETILEHVIGEALMLPDTYNIMDGITKAIRAGGGEKVFMVRQDSNIYNLDSDEALSTEDTVRAIHDLWVDLGRPANDHAVTNDLNEYSLQVLADEEGDKVSMVSIGGGIATGSGPSHGNYVYKLVEFEVYEGQGADRKLVRKVYPVKVANGAKSTEPGKKDIYRYFSPDGKKMLRDLKVLAGSPAPEGATLLTRSLVRGGKRVLTSSSPDQMHSYIFDQVAQLPAEYQELTRKTSEGRRIPVTRSLLNSESKLYPVDSSAELAAIREKAIQETIPPEEFRVLVIFGSFDPVTDEGHIRMAYRLSALYRDQSNPLGFNKILFVPARDEPAHDKEYRLKALARINVLKRKLKNFHKAELETLASRKSKLEHALPEIEVWDGEVNYTGVQPPYTYDTLKAISRQYPGARLMSSMGEDTFYTIGRSEKPWKDADKLLNEFDWIVVKRAAKHGDAAFEADKIDTMKMMSAFTKKPYRLISPSGSQVRFLDLKLAAVSSTQIRDFYDNLGIAFRSHITDPQETFLVRSQRPTEKNKLDGTLAVQGTHKTIDYILSMVKATRRINNAVITGSGDAHFKEEKIYPHLNEGEFFTMNFPMHGEINTEGPGGDAWIEELEAIIPRSSQLRIPAHELVFKEGDAEWKAKHSGVLRPEWKLADFDWAQHEAKITDPNSVLRFDKQGPGSYDVFVNPRYYEYLEKIDPYRILPHFHSAWATDYCVYSVVKGELLRGFRSIVVIDTIAGVFPRQSADRIRELKALGAQFITTKDFTSIVTKLETIQNGGKKVTWSDTLNALADWEATQGELTNNWLVKLLAKYPPLKPEEGPGAPGEVLFQRDGMQHALPKQEGLSTELPCDTALKV
jgi:nicotinate phosphoribosyltransferase